jgi:hypothetical protein
MMVLLILQLVSFVVGARLDSTLLAPQAAAASASLTAASSQEVAVLTEHSGSQPTIACGDTAQNDEDDQDDFVLATVMVVQMPTLRAAVSPRGAAARLRQPITLREPPPYTPPTSVV